MISEFQERGFRTLRQAGMPVLLEKFDGAFDGAVAVSA